MYSYYYVFVLLYLCILIILLCNILILGIFIVILCTLNCYLYLMLCYVPYLLWYVFLFLCYVMFSCFYVYVFLLLCMFRSVYSVSLCCSVCKCVPYCCHRVSTQWQLTDTYHTISRFDKNRHPSLMSFFIVLLSPCRRTLEYFPKIGHERSIPYFLQ
jgi:hypothetical protein